MCCSRGVRTNLRVNVYFATLNVHKCTRARVDSCDDNFIIIYFCKKSDGDAETLFRQNCDTQSVTRPLSVNVVSVSRWLLR